MVIINPMSMNCSNLFLFHQYIGTPFHCLQ